MIESIYILMPAYNEGAIIKDTINKLTPYFKNIVVVNDGSSDNTEEILMSCNIKLLNHKINLGVGAAAQTGFQYISSQSSAAGLITFDADGQHSVEDALKFSEEILKCEEEIIFGSRFLGFDKNIPLIKRLVLRMVNKITNFMTGVILTDAHNGMKAFKISAIKKINIELTGYAYESEIISEIARKKIKYKELPTDIKYTNYSIKKGQKLSSGLLILEDLLTLLKK